MAESSRGPSAALSRALELATDTLADPPAGLLTDFDGTLSPIVTDPAAARLVEGASGALAELARRLAVVAVITGRAPMDARRMTDVAGLLVVGNHGTEWLQPDATKPTASPEADAVSRRVGEALDRLPTLPGMTVERKGVSATVHYRTAADPEHARRAITAAMAEPGHGLEVRQGRMSVELRPVGLGDKGTAARAVIERYGLRGAVVMGDDLTDLDMFGAVEALRGEGRLRGAIVGVGGADREVPPQVVDGADVVLADPAEAALLLVGLSRSLRS